MTKYQLAVARIERDRKDPVPDLGEPPDIIREWADKVIQSWGLTAVEREVCDVLLKGFSDQEIAQHLNRGAKSVMHTIWTIRKKARVESRAELFAEILRL